MGPIRNTRPVRLVVLLSAIWLAVASSVAGQDGRGATTAFQRATQTWSPPLTGFGHPDLQGVWVNKRATPFERPATLQGRQSLTDAEVAELERRANRIFWGGGSDLGDPLYGYHEIFQAPDYVVLLLEAFHDARIIPLDGRPPLSQRVRQWNGDSRGRWDGQTLVIESQNFSPKSSFLGAAGNLRVVERLTRVSLDTIECEVTFDDPTTWTATPWTAVIYLTLTTDKIYEYGCHEGNAEPMKTMLSIARMEEKATMEAGIRD